MTPEEIAQELQALSNRLLGTESIAYNPALTGLAFSRVLSILALIVGGRTADLTGAAGMREYRSDTNKLRLFDTAWENVATEAWAMPQSQKVTPRTLFFRAAACGLNGATTATVVD